MAIQSRRELENTRAKLRRLEDLYVRKAAEPLDDPKLREFTLRSLKQLINQFKEEIARFEARAAQTAK